MPVGIVLALLLTSGTPLRAQAAESLATRAQKLGGPPGYQGREEGETISIDLATRSFKTTLPFDVSFKVQGPISEGFEELSARFIEFNRVPDCLGFFRPAEVLVARGDSIPVRPRRPALAIESSGFRSAAVAADKKTFVVEFPPLRPNRYYCFEFISKKQVDADTLAALRQNFATAIDTELRKDKYKGKRKLEDFGTQARVGVDTLADYKALRQTLIAEVETQLGQDQTLLAPGGSFFDVNTAFDAIQNTYRVEFEAILTEQQTKYAYTDNVLGKANQAARFLVQLRAQTFTTPSGARRLTALLTDDSLGLESFRNQSGFDLVEVLGVQNGAELMAIVAKAAQRVAVAAGVTAEEAALPAIGDLWEERDIDALIASARALSEAVATLATLGDLAEFDQESIDRLTDPRGLIARATDAIGEQDEEGWSGIVEDLRNLRGTLAERSELIQKMTDALVVEVRQVVRIGGTTVANYETRAIWYMSADVGSGLSWDTEDFFTYIGWNIYFRPVNKKAHLSWAGRPFTLREEFMRRFSFTLGLVQSGFEEENGRFKGVVGNSAAVLGAGFRINDSLRFSVGGLVFENEDPSPLITRTKLNWSPYAAISFDWNATATIAGLFK